MSLDPLLNQVPFQNRKRVKDDVAKLMLTYKTLLPKIGSLISNKGVESKVVVLSGTVPIYYLSNQYNIPVEIFLSQSYPVEAPKIYVRPTPNMTIKSNHRHVDLQGLVFLPYLHDWRSESNLTQLVQLTSNVFSAEPPLFSKPPTAAPSPILQAYSNSSATASPVTAIPSPTPVSLSAYPQRPPMSATPSAYGAPSNGSIAYSGPTAGSITYANSANLYNPVAAPSALPAAQPASLTPYGTAYDPRMFASPAMGSNNSSNNNNNSRSSTSSAVATAYPAPPAPLATVASVSANPSPTTIYSPSSFGITPTSSAQATATAAAEAQKLKDKRNKLIADVTRKMRDSLHSSQEALRDEMDVEFTTEQYLIQSNAKAQANLQQLQEQITKYEAAIKTISEKDAELTTWSETEKEKPVLDAEQRLEPFDDLAAQIIKLNGELNAIDDAFYYLERALVDQSNKSVDLTSFLKENRRLARQQFMCKATLMKINASYMQQQSIANQTQQAQQRQANAVPNGAHQYYPAPAAPMNGMYGQPSSQYGGSSVTQQPSQQWPVAPTATVVPPAASTTHHNRNRAKLTIL